MKFFFPLILVIFLILSPSCRKTESDPTPAIDPFANGTNVRNMIVVVSDMHMGADEAYTECKDNRAPLAKLLGQMRVSPNVKELVIAGDLIDEWFVPADVDTYAGKDQVDFVQRLAATNKVVFDALNQIIQEGKIKVTYVPGNHDLAITAANVSLILPGINQARDDQQGLGTYTPTDFPILAIEHGHRYNFACAPDPISNKVIAPGSIMPPGYFFTRIAALAAKQNVAIHGDTLPDPKPNTTGDESQYLAYQYWKSWIGLVEMFPITNRFNVPLIITNINGFTQTYSVDDIVPYQLTDGGYIDMNLFKGIYDTANWNQREVLNQVAVKFPVTQAMADADDNSKTDDQAKTQYFMNPDSDKRIVVFGHTHQPEIIASNNTNGEYCIYANSGTWIDNNPHQTTMNFVVITPENTTDIHSQTYVKLYNFMNDVVSLMAVDELRYTK
ncbi:MAG: metallophosphoesterase [Bacteroidales bacterium]|nr:metallophosphoesterase [Bacteroidales bacterium]